MEPLHEGEDGRQLAAAGLRAAIGAGDLAPGQRLVEPEIASAHGVSRAALRAALIDLTAEGLVERIPNKGARVRVISVAEAVEIAEARMVLEGLCASAAARRVTDGQAAHLADLGVRMRTAVAGGDPVGYSALNRELHQAIQDISGHRVAGDLLDRLRAQLVRHQFRLALRPGRPAESLPQHIAIIDAVVARQPGAAEAAARAHLTSVVAALQEES